MRDARDLLDEVAQSYTPGEGDLESTLEEVRRRSHAYRVNEREAQDEGRTAQLQPVETRVRRRRVVASGVLAAACLAIASIAVADSPPSEEEVAAQYSLQPHPWSPVSDGEPTMRFSDDGLEVNGSVVDDSDCNRAANPDKVIVAKIVDDHFYCIVATNYLEAWVIGQKLAGDPPTDEEIAEMGERLRTSEG